MWVVRQFGDGLARRGYLLPLGGFLLGLAVIVIAPWYFFGTDHPPPVMPIVKTLPWQEVQKDPRAAVRDRTARSVMEMAKLLLGVASLYTLLRCAINFVRRWRDYGAAKYWALGFVFLAVVLCVNVVNAPTNKFWVNSIPAQLFVEAAERTGSQRLLVVSRVDHLLVQLAIILVTAAVALEVSVTVTTVEQLGHQLKRLRELLYHAAIVLVVLSLAGASNILWAAALLPPEDAEYVKQMALGVALDAGVFNVILLILVFSPAIWLVTRQVPVLLPTLPEEANEMARKEIMATHGLVRTPTEYYIQLGTILAPLLGGVPLTALLGYLLK